MTGPGRRRLAEALAQAAGLHLKGVERMATGVRMISQPPGELYPAAALARATPLEVGEEEITAHIQAVFGLQP